MCKRKYGYLHSKIEHTLLNNIEILKDRNNDYWGNFINLDPDVGEFTAILMKMKEITNYIKDEETKNDLVNAYKIWEDGMNNHDIGKLFEVHEIIHDYDYWIINTPLELAYPPADWSGINIYFGKANIMN